jgi:hypothetical protein
MLREGGALMPDYRTKRQKLEDMAEDQSSPNEAREVSALR